MADYRPESVVRAVTIYSPRPAVRISHMEPPDHGLFFWQALASVSRTFPVLFGLAGYAWGDDLWRWVQGLLS